MHKHDGMGFYVVTVTLTTIQTMASEAIKRGQMNELQNLDKESKHLFLGLMTVLRSSTSELDLDFVLVSIDRLLPKLHEGGVITNRELIKIIEEIQLRLLDSLQTTYMLSLSRSEAALFEPAAPAFGRAFETAFPNSAFDVDESGKCLALGRYTATVFHLMRAMESMLQVLAGRLGVSNTEREWGKLLSDISRKIEAMPKGDQRNKWSETHTHLYHVKQAWRNDTMHPKQSYAGEEARAIFEAVKVFAGNLAELTLRT